MAERTGFEPAEAVNLARFPSVCLKPLDHLSKYVCSATFCTSSLHRCPNRIPFLSKLVNDYLLFFAKTAKLCVLTLQAELNPPSKIHTDTQCVPLAFAAKDDETHNNYAHNGNLLSSKCQPSYIISALLRKNVQRLASTLAVTRNSATHLSCAKS